MVFGILVPSRYPDGYASIVDFPTFVLKGENDQDSTLKRKRPSILPITLSIAMVLFIMGLLGSVLINSQHITQHFKENVMVMVYFNKQATKDDISKARQEIVQMPSIKRSEFISPEDAAFTFRDELGENFVEILGDNPLPPSMELYLDMAMVKDDPQSVVDQLSEIPVVYEVEYEAMLMERINANKEVITYSLIGAAFLLLIICVILMNNMIRLSVYSKRFTIKSMQLVGAREWYIIRPFVTRSIYIAMISGLIAAILTYVVSIGTYSWLYNVYFESAGLLPDVGEVVGIREYSILFVALLILGLAIVIPVTYWSTRRFLRMKIDDLY